MSDKTLIDKMNEGFVRVTELVKANSVNSPTQTLKAHIESFQYVSKSNGFANVLLTGENFGEDLQIKQNNGQALATRVLTPKTAMYDINESEVVHQIQAFNGLIPPFLNQIFDVDLSFDVSSVLDMYQKLSSLDITELKGSVAGYRDFASDIEAGVNQISDGGDDMYDGGGIVKLKTSSSSTQSQLDYNRNTVTGLTELDYLTQTRDLFFFQSYQFKQVVYELNFYANTGFDGSGQTNQENFLADGRRILSDELTNTNEPSVLHVWVYSESDLSCTPVFNSNLGELNVSLRDIRVDDDAISPMLTHFIFKRENGNMATQSEIVAIINKFVEKGLIR